MALSNDLVSQFVKATKNENPREKETITYGTIVKDEVSGELYVQLDGANSPTPISTTSDILAGQRVIVMIKNHTATVIGNISSPSAQKAQVVQVEEKADEAVQRVNEYDLLIADKVSTEDFYAELGKIGRLETDTLLSQTVKANEASVETLTADNVEIRNKLEAAEADISNLSANKLSASEAKATYAEIKELDVVKESVKELDAEQGEFQELTAERFNAVNARIDSIDAGSLTVEELEAKFANIDFSNISKAAIEHFYSESGLIEDVIVGDGTITGRLVGVTISGDLIEGNTVVAEKLVIKGEDGLYYKLNTDGVSTEAEQTDYNSLNGSIIKAKSITANKIDVKDLVAFAATIGGINISEGALYSGAKESVDNTTKGFYLDKDGQFAVGDSTQYVKYYKLQNGNYALAISAEQILLASSGKNVADEIESAKNAASSAQSTASSASSTASEALSAANTANDALSEIDADIIQVIQDTEIGGRNLLLGTSFDNIGLFSTHGSYGTVEKTDDGIKLTVPSGSNSGIDFPLAFDGCLENNTEYTLTFQYRTNTTWTRAIYAKQRSGQNISVNMSWNAFSPSDTNWYTFSITISSPNMNSGNVYALLLPYNNGFWMEIKAKSLKLEKGLMVTDWTPAPEDMVTTKELDEVESVATDAQTRVGDAEAAIEVLSESISMLVTDGNGASLMKQTESGWTFSTAEIQEQVNRASEGLSALTDEIGDTNSAVSILQQAVEDLGEIAEYVKIGTYEDEPCIELGESDSEFKLRITNTRMIFAEGSVVLAYFNNQSLHIKKAVVEEEFQQGGFVWKARPNGNLGLVWKGVSN